MMYDWLTSMVSVLAIVAFGAALIAVGAGAYRAGVESREGSSMPEDKQEETKEPSVIESALKQDEAAAEAAFAESKDKVEAADRMELNESEPVKCEIEHVHVLCTLAEGAELPSYESAGASGADLKALKDTVIPRQSVQLVKTGLRIAVSPGYEAQVRSRSGLALKKQVFVLNAPGTIDCDYRGDVGVILFNAGTTPYEVKKGDRIAQLVIAPVCRGDLVPLSAETFDDCRPSVRGEGGFGSTGK